MQIDKNETYQTRDGREARIYAVDGVGAHPVHGAIKDKNGQWLPKSWASNGDYLAGGEICNSDLVLGPKRHTREVWINMYTEGRLLCFNSEQDARFARATRMTACKHLVFEFVEGEGL